MADRVMRGSRLGAVSYETDRNHDLAPRQIARYRTENGEEFEVPFADDADIPGTWLCRNGMEGTLIEGAGTAGAFFIEKSRHTTGFVACPPIDHGLARDRESARDLDMGNTIGSEQHDSRP